MSADINYKSNFVSYVLADRDVILFVYEVPFIFWHYINVGEVRWITLKTLLQSAMELLQNCNSFVYFKVRWTVITNCDSFFITTVRHGYYKLRQVFQSAIHDLLQIATDITKCDDYYKLRQYASLFLVEQGWRSGESTRLPPVWPGLESWRRRHMWAEFVVGSLHCSERFFCGYSSFPLSLKTNTQLNTSKFQFADLERTDTFQRVLKNSTTHFNVNIINVLYSKYAVKVILKTY